jgi:hypothetical protein
MPNDKDIIKDNYQLLAIIGVFGALTAYFSTLSENLSFITLMIVILLSIEFIDRNPPSSIRNKRMKLFMLLFIALIVVLIANFISTYQELLNSLADFLVFIAVLFFVGIFASLCSGVIISLLKLKSQTWRSPLIVTIWVVLLIWLFSENLLTF